MLFSVLGVGFFVAVSVFVSVFLFTIIPPLRQRKRGQVLNQQYDNCASSKSETGTDGSTGTHSKRFAVGRLGSRE